MATLFPTALDTFTNPTSSSNLNDVGVEHHTQHANANDAIEALQVAVGITGSTDVTSLEYKLAQKQPVVTLVAPASATATGTAGQIVITAGFIYTCVATNTWERVATATWV